MGAGQSNSEEIVRYGISVAASAADARPMTHEVAER